jgi:hypothetical protein
LTGLQALHDELRMGGVTRTAFYLWQNHQIRYNTLQRLRPVMRLAKSCLLTSTIYREWIYAIIRHLKLA